MTDTEPYFHVYDAEKHNITDEHRLGEEELPFNPEETAPEYLFNSYEELREFLDNHDSEKYVWMEIGQETAPIRTVCSVCDAKLKTSSEQRFQEARSMHHISTGH